MWSDNKDNHWSISQFVFLALEGLFTAVKNLVLYKILKVLLKYIYF